MGEGDGLRGGTKTRRLMRFSWEGSCELERDGTILSVSFLFSGP